MNTILLRQKTIKSKKNTRNSYLLRVYGITLSQYNDLLKAQGGTCAICHKPPKLGKNLAVEHDHVSRFIRGLACMYCNRRLIGRHRDGALLRRIADYVEQHSGLRVPEKKKKRKKKCTR